MEQAMKQIFRAANSSLRGGPAAFSLLELLVVMALLIVLMALATPAVNSLMTGANLSRGGQQFVDQILLARQTAITRNRDVEVRFFDLGSADAPSWSVQLWIADETGTNRSPAQRLQRLPEGITISPAPEFSPLLFGAGATISGNANTSSHGDKPFVGFRFRANGETDIPSETGTNSASNFLTLQYARHKDAALPPNFFGIQVNPFTGRVTVYRP